MTDLWVHPESLSGTLGSAGEAEEACATASFVLWALSGRKYTKTRTVTETYECPCHGSGLSQFRGVPVGSGAAVGGPYPGLVGGEVVNAGSPCGCSAEDHSRLRLRGMPVRAVQEVTRDGEALTPGTYRVLNSGVLEVDQGLPGGACGLTVTYIWGTGIPAAGAAAARRMAEELVKGWTGDDDCALPSRVTNVTREGVSFTVMDKQEFLDDLRTGVYEVDLFLRAVNPDRARRRARVFSPDVPRPVQTTWE